MGDTSFRYDVAQIENHELTPEGYLRCFATIARTGVQNYRSADGSTRREYRPEEQVASPESLASFAGKAVTFEHPPLLLDSANTKSYSIGFSGTEVVYDNGFVRAVMTITDQDSIDKIMRGDAREVSAGYKVEYDRTPGTTPDGEEYDGIQKQIVGNHIAVVRRGRAGPQVKLHLDSQDAADPQFNFIEDAMSVSKVAFDGAEFEVSEGVALAISKERQDAKMSYDGMKKKYDELIAEADQLKKDMQCMEDELKGKCDSAEGRADALGEELEVVKSELAAAKEVKLDELVEKRIALIDKARTTLDSEFSFSGLSDREVMEASIKAIRGDSDLSEKSDDYVTAMFDTLIETAAERGDSAGTEELRQAVSSIAAPAVAKDSYLENLTNAWKAPLTTSKEAR